MSWLGNGYGCGLSLVYVIGGLTGTALSLAALAHQRFRNIDRLIPDGRRPLRAVNRRRRD